MNVKQAVENARTNPEVALWFTNRIGDFELTRVFTQAWCEAIEKKSCCETMEKKEK